MPEPRPSPEAQVVAIRATLIDTYGEDYAGEDVAAAIDLLFRHQGEHEANVQRILQAKNGALEKAQAERDHWKREHDELFLTWQILAERTLVASTLVAEDMPADVEAELAPVRLDVLRKVLAGEAGRDDLTASLLPTLAEAEQRRDERTEAMVERLRAELAERKANAEGICIDLEQWKARAQLAEAELSDLQERVQKLTATRIGDFRLVPATEILAALAAPETPGAKRVNAPRTANPAQAPDAPHGESERRRECRDAHE